MKDEEKKGEIDARVALEKGGLIGSAMVSDAFFPFRDGVDVGIKEGVTSVVQPGGAMNDHEVINACNESDVTMVFTGQRSFKALAHFLRQRINRPQRISHSVGGAVPTAADATP